MSRLREGLRSDDHVAGPRSAPVILVEYGDYECPYCGRAFGEVKQLQRALGDRLCFVFRNFPITQLHPHAMAAAEAAESAGAQGRFWEMHDLLYVHQQALDTPSLLLYARELELDLRGFERDLVAHTFAERIRHDFMTGVRSGVNGTPTFFINGERHDGASSFEALLAAVQERQAAYGA